MSLNPMHLSVAKLLDGRLFQIPDYQRAYSWQTRQRKDLFSDIEEAHRSGREHFMATVVALARDKRWIAADEFQTAELVDGQQRITTIVILLKAIEKALPADGDSGQSKAKHVLGSLLVKGDDHSLVLLQTNHDSSNVFTSYIRTGRVDQKSISAASDKNIVDAVEECETFVADWAANGKIIDLLGTIRNRLTMVYHELSDEATVYRVFEVLNSRGLDVRWIDKTKSQLMASIFEFVDEGSRADALREMRSIWQDIYRILGLKQQLGSESLRFAATLSIETRPNRVLGEEDAALELIKSGGNELRTIVDTAQWLRKMVRLVSDLNSDKRRAAVTKISHARFLAISIMAREFDKEVQEELLSAWEKITFRIFGLFGADTRMKVGEYVRLAQSVFKDNLSSDQILKYINELGRDYCVEDLLSDNDFWSNSYEGWAEELRYLLFRYDEYLAAQSGEQINQLQWNKIWTLEPSTSVEHIVPQSADAEFKHHLGNLVMLTPGMNSSLQDDPPCQKSDAYVSCGLRDTMAVGAIIKERGDWDEVQVTDRAARIGKFVRIEWGD